MKNSIESILKEISEIQLPKQFMTNIEYNFDNNELLKYYLPAKTECCFLDSE